MKTASDADMAAMKEDISQLQDLSGQSERQLRDMRAAVEEKTPRPMPRLRPTARRRQRSMRRPAAVQVPRSCCRPDAISCSRAATSAARGAFSELITKYPHSDLVPEAMFYTAQAYAAERKPMRRTRNTRR